MHIVLKWLNKGLDILFPKFCIGCKKEGGFLCDVCFGEIKTITNQIFTEPDAPVFYKLFIPCSYHKNKILKRALHLMKYKFYRDLCGDLANLLINFFTRYPLPKNTILVPVPLHKKRLKFRGFNQSEIIAKHIGEKMNISVVNLLIRKTETVSQATLNRTERLKNVKNAFIINPEIIINKNTPILLVDDVCTTLSTIKSAGETLQKNGFRVIMGSAIARANLDKNL